jgi:membrane protease YdiL (CAAX protease family)
MIAIVFGLTLAWDLFQFGLTMPILNRITGERQDLSQFAGLQGNLGALLISLAVSWTLAAVGEEIVSRGHLPLRITDMFGASTVGILAAAVVLSSVLSGSPTLSKARSGSSSRFSMRCSSAFCDGASRICGRPSLATDSTTQRPGQLLSRWPDLRTVITSNGR